MDRPYRAKYSWFGDKHHLCCHDALFNELQSQKCFLQQTLSSFLIVPAAVSKPSERSEMLKEPALSEDQPPPYITASSKPSATESVTRPKQRASYDSNEFCTLYLLQVEPGEVDNDGVVLIGKEIEELQDATRIPPHTTFKDLQQLILDRIRKQSGLKRPVNRLVPYVSDKHGLEMRIVDDDSWQAARGWLADGAYFIVVCGYVPNDYVKSTLKKQGRRGRQCVVQ